MKRSLVCDLCMLSFRVKPFSRDQCVFILVSTGCQVLMDDLSLRV